MATLTTPPDVLWLGYLLFVFTDALASIPRKRQWQAQSCYTAPPKGVERDRPHEADLVSTVSSSADTGAIYRKISMILEKPFLELIEKNISKLRNKIEEVLVIDDLPASEKQTLGQTVDLLVGRTRINDVIRLNRFLRFCAGRIRMGDQIHAS